MKETNFKIGQRITFKSPTRNGNVKATRIINGTINGLPTVRFNGWVNFIIRQNEIIEIN
tara:strand:+ start:438 stop:614 length:177 start_codon:yes stop_codon:yes gene_type:complete